jgi:hypothetical protein
VSSVPNLPPYVATRGLVGRWFLGGTRSDGSPGSVWDEPRFLPSRCDKVPDKGRDFGLSLVPAKQTQFLYRVWADRTIGTAKVGPTSDGAMGEV